MTSLKFLMGVAGAAIAATATGSAQAQSTPQWGTQTDTTVQASTSGQLQTTTAVQTDTTVSPTLGKTEAGVGTSTGSKSSTKSGGTASSPLSQVGLQGNNAVGPNGQKVGANGNNPVGPDGKAVGAGYNTAVGPNGQSLSTNGIGQASTGGGTADQYGGQGVHLNNGGMAGASDTPSDAPDKPTGKVNTGTSVGPDGKDQNADYSNRMNALNDDWGHPATGKDSQGNTWKDNQLVNGTDQNGGTWRNGHRTSPGVYGSNLEAGDFDNKFGSGSSTSASGQTVKGKVGGGQDTGGGQTGQGNTGGSAQNATGQTLNVGAVAGQDSPLKKPKTDTPVDTNKLNNGVTDPSKAGTTTGG